MTEPVRSLVLWFPDWPVAALWREHPEHAGEAVVIVHAGVVVACSPAARADGVRRGQRRRDAQACSPRARVIAASDDRDQRMFAPVVSAVERTAPGVQIIRPGLCALRARGPARYHGGENAACCLILDDLAEQHGLPGVRAGVADGPFTAEQAARATAPDDPVRIVPPGEAARFLAPLPVAVLQDSAVASLLQRLGVRTLGAFAALDSDDVADRLGPHGARLHTLAAGGDSSPVTPRTPPPELARQVVFEPAVDLAEQVAFGMRRAADEFIRGLAAQALVCTQLRVELTGDRGEHSERVWLHPGSFDAADVIDRVRWQLAEDAQNEVLRSGVIAARIVPDAVDAASAHREAVFGTAPDERVHHALSRVQAMLGHRGVVTPVIAGGRWAAERQVLVPWGDRAAPAPGGDRPWPGRMPRPAPAVVYPAPVPVDVIGPGGVVCDVDDRGELTAPPARLREGGRDRAVVSWAGPWTVDERAWDPARTRLAHRFQVVDDDRAAWLLVCEGGRWSAEARYD